jgi:putative thioredoxin
MGGAAAKIDVGDADFEREVIERSRERPVVVDFWAAWCGPCRALGPILERLVEEHAGAFVLAKLDVDRAPATAQRYGVRSIPLVLAFRDGEPVAEFVGAQPEPVVRKFLAGVLPGKSDRLAAEGDELQAAGHENAAEARYRGALEGDPRHGRALVGLARLLAGREDVAGALELLERVVPTGATGREAERLAAELRTRAEPAADLAALRAQLARAPGDLAARLALGRALVARKDYAGGLGELLAVVSADPGFEDQAARRAMLDVFEVLGRDHPLTERFRAELARALFR